MKNEIRQLVNEALDHYACDMRALAENTTTKDLKEAYSKKALEIQTLRKTMNDCYIVPKNFLTPILQLIFWAVVFAVFILAFGYIGEWFL